MNDLYNDYREDSDEYVSITQLIELTELANRIYKYYGPSYYQPRNYMNFVSGYYSASYCNAVIFLLLRGRPSNYKPCSDRVISILVMDGIMEKDPIL